MTTSSMRRSARIVAECPTLRAFLLDCAARAFSHLSSRHGCTWLIRPFCLKLHLGSLVIAIMSNSFIVRPTRMINIMQAKSSFCAVAPATPRATCSIGHSIDTTNVCTSHVNSVTREPVLLSGSASAALHGLHAHCQDH